MRKPGILPGRRCLGEMTDYQRTLNAIPSTLQKSLTESSPVFVPTWRIRSGSICVERLVFLEEVAIVKMQLGIVPLIYQCFHAKQIFTQRQHALGS